MNPLMLYVRHLGFKGAFEKKLADRDPKALELKNAVDEVKQLAKSFMKIRAVWQFFEAESEGNKIHLFKPGSKKPLHTFTFNRQRKENGLCLADYVLTHVPHQRPATSDQRQKRDSIALFVVTAGENIRKKSEELKNKGEYLKSHALQALALETAEAAAEWLHRRIREDWGFPDDPKTTMKDRFQAAYHGKRYSFGYPACPRLEDQEGIWKLLEPQDIGVELTEGFMMEPEASVSALVFHHPDCVYFGALDLILN
jgi:5-methyltetrahydrofolate--homocysteine methyltransferase